MVSELPHEFRKFSRNCSHLRRILKETNRCLDEITSGEREHALTIAALEKIAGILECHPALVVLGQSCNAKACLVNALLGEALLPLGGSLWRWIRIQYGLTSHIALTLGQQFEVVEHLHVNEKPWTTLPEDDLRRSECDERLWPEHSTVLEVQIFHPLMRDSVHVVIPPDCESLKPSLFIEMLHRNLNKSLPIFLYALEEDTLSEYNISELEKLNQVFPNIPVFFVCTSGSLPPPYPQELTESEQHQLQENKITYRQAVTDNKISMESDIEYIDKSLHSLLQRLTSLGYLNLKNLDLDKPRIKSQPYGQLSVSSEFIDGLHKLDKLQIFIRGCLQCHLVQAANTLNDIQGQCIQKVILSAFDMAREIQITPRRILYAQKKEGELYKNLMAISNEKQEEITQLIQVTLKDMKDNLVEKAGDYCYQGVTLSDSEEIKSAQSVHIATVEIQNWVLSWLSDSVASQLVKSVDCLQDTFVGTLQRCLESLEKNCQDQEGSLLASAAVKQNQTETDLHLQILSAAYNVELTTSTSSSVLHSFIERLRKLLYGLQLPWTQAPRLDSEWRKRVATEMLNSLNAARLARSISAQFRDRVRSSHEAFQTAIHSLESHYTGHLVRTEEQRVAIRKLHAPRLARLSLESTSLSDMVQYDDNNIVSLLKFSGFISNLKQPSPKVWFSNRRARLRKQLAGSSSSYGSMGISVPYPSASSSYILPQGLPESAFPSTSAQMPEHHSNSLYSSHHHAGNTVPNLNSPSVSLCGADSRNLTTATPSYSVIGSTITASSYPATSLLSTQMSSIGSSPVPVHHHHHHHHQQHHMSQSPSPTISSSYLATVIPHHLTPIIGTTTSSSSAQGPPNNPNEPIDAITTEMSSHSASPPHHMTSWPSIPLSSSSSSMMSSSQHHLPHHSHHQHHRNMSSPSASIISTNTHVNHSLSPTILSTNVNMNNSLPPSLHSAGVGTAGLGSFSHHSSSTAAGFVSTQTRAHHQPFYSWY